MTQPLVSIASITYNHEQYIAQAIESWLMQNVNFPIEIVIGDDCSADNTPLIIKEFQKKHPELIRIISTERNVGMMPNFIRTLEACKGKYIALCEGDDYWTDPNKLQVQVDFLKTNPDFVMSYHDTTVVDDDGDLIQNSALRNEYKKDYSKTELIHGNHTVTCSRVFKNVPIKFNKKIIKIPGADVALSSLLGDYGKGKYHEELAGAASYRVHENGIYSGKEKFYKMWHYFKTRYFLGKYYDGIGKVDEAEHFENMAFQIFNNILEYYIRVETKSLFMVYLKIAVKSPSLKEVKYFSCLTKTIIMHKLNELALFKSKNE